MSFSVAVVGGRGLFCVDEVSVMGKGGTGLSEGGADSEGGVGGSVGHCIGGRGFGGCEE